MRWLRQADCRDVAAFSRVAGTPLHCAYRCFYFLPTGFLELRFLKSYIGEDENGILRQLEKQPFQSEQKQTAEREDDFAVIRRALDEIYVSGLRLFAATSERAGEARDNR